MPGLRLKNPQLARMPALFRSQQSNPINKHYTPERLATRKWPFLRLTQIGPPTAMDFRSPAMDFHSSTQSASMFNAPHRLPSPSLHPAVPAAARPSLSCGACARLPHTSGRSCKSVQSRNPWCGRMSRACIGLAREPQNRCLGVGASLGRDRGEAARAVQTALGSVR